MEAVALTMVLGLGKGCVSLETHLCILKGLAQIQGSADGRGEANQGMNSSLMK